MTMPRFVRFCRALALVGGPCVAGVVFVPAFVEGCSSDVASGVQGIGPNDSNLPEGTVLEDTRPRTDTADVLQDVGDTQVGEIDASDAGEAGDGGPGAPPDLPFFASVQA